MSSSPASRRVAVSCFSLALALTVFGQGRSTGSISGTVVDENGAPTPEVSVNADLMDGKMQHSLVRYVQTDSKGHFLIDRLEWGTYKISVVKEEANYPNTALAFYGNDVLKLATVTPGDPAAELTINLGPKAGILTGSIKNITNGAPLNASCKLTRAASPDKWLSTSASSTYRMLIPSATDVLLEVFVPGFKPWSPSHPLRLQPGEELHLDISPEPSHDPDIHPSRFLVPEGYVGWLLLEYNVKDAKPAPTDNNKTKIFKFPESGALNTSSRGPERGAEDEYLYYSPDGSTRTIPMDYRNGKAMVWGQHEGVRHGELCLFGFFVGNEEQYKKFQHRMLGPVPVQ